MSPLNYSCSKFLSVFSWALHTDTVLLLPHTVNAFNITSWSFSLPAEHHLFCVSLNQSSPYRLRPAHARNAWHSALFPSIKYTHAFTARKNQPTSSFSLPRSLSFSSLALFLPPLSLSYTRLSESLSHSHEQRALKELDEAAASLSLRLRGIKTLQFPLLNDFLQTQQLAAEIFWT